MKYWLIEFRAKSDKDYTFSIPIPAPSRKKAIVLAKRQQRFLAKNKQWRLGHVLEVEPGAGDWAVAQSHNDTLDAMVDRFLCWRLPRDFAPDAGISFSAPTDEAYWPIGTNLLTGEQAKQLFLDCVFPIVGWAEGRSPTASEASEADVGRLSSAQPLSASPDKGRSGGVPDTDIAFADWMEFYGWRDVKDEVPPPLEDVIVAHGDPRTGLLIDIGWRSTKGTWHHHTGDKARLEVRFWQGLPLLPPKPAKDNHP